MRHWLGLLIAGCLLPSLVVAALLLTHQYRRELALHAWTTVQSAHAASATLDERLKNVELALRALAASPELRAGNLPGLHAEASTVRDTERVNAVLVLAPDGRQLLNTRVEVGQPLPMRSSEDQMTPFRTGRPLVNDLLTGVVARKPLFTVAVPATREGTVTHVVLAGIETETVADVLAQQRLPAGWTARVVDGRGAVVAGWPNHAGLVGSVVPAAQRDAIRARREGTFDDAARTGDDVFTAFSRLPDSSWAVVVDVPMSQIRGPVVQSTLLAAGLIALAAGGALVFGSWSAGRLAGSIEGLSRAAQSLGRGEHMPLAPTSFAEAGLVGQALKSAAADLRSQQEALARQEDRERLILRTGSEPMLGVDADDRVVLCNDAASQLLGLSREAVEGEVIGAVLTRRFAVNDVQRVLGQLHAVPAAGVPATAVVPMQRPDGLPAAFEFSCARASAGDRSVRMLTARDVTEREYSREALMRSNADLQRFAFAASHDLRTPLRSIKGFLGLLRERHPEALVGKPGELVGRAAAAADHLDQLTSDLLMYARLGHADRALVPVDCNAVVAATLELLSMAMGESGASVRVGPLPTVLGDESLLTQTFQNLITNAIRYAGARPPRIEISAERNGAEWRFCVRDHGIGIPAAQRERVFGIFERLHTQSEVPGTGMGLALCRRVIDRLGGRIWAEGAGAGPDGAEGEGTRILFTLPALKETHEHA